MVSVDNCWKTTGNLVSCKLNATEYCVHSMQNCCANCIPINVDKFLISEAIAVIWFNQTMIWWILWQLHVGNIQTIYCSFHDIVHMEVFKHVAYDCPLNVGSQYSLDTNSLYHVEHSPTSLVSPSVNTNVCVCVCVRECKPTPRKVYIHSCTVIHT